MARAWLLVVAAGLAVAAAALAAAVAMQGDEPTLDALPVKDQPAPEPCFGDLPSAPAALRGLDLARSASLHRELRQNVSLDEDTIMSVIALSRATGVPIGIEEVTNRTTHRFEICAFDLAVSEDNASYTVQRVVAFRVTTSHNASLDRDTAMSAIALNASGVPVDPREVITFAHDERVERTFDQVVDSEDVFELVLAKIREDAALATRSPASATPRALPAPPAPRTTTPTTTAAPPTPSPAPARTPLGTLLGA
jgi:hypothetical protein